MKYKRLTQLTSPAALACRQWLAPLCWLALAALAWLACEKSLKPLKMFKIQLIITTTVIAITVSK